MREQINSRDVQGISKGSRTQELRNSLWIQTVQGVQKILPSSLRIKENWDIVWKRTGNVYASIDISSFRKIPNMDKNFYDGQKDGDSSFFRDKNGIYLYEGERNVFHKIDGASNEMQEVRYASDNLYMDTFNTLDSTKFISNGKLFNGYGKEVFTFPDGKKWNKDVVIYWDFKLIEAKDGTLYTGHINELRALPMKKADVWIKVREWYFPENLTSGQEIYLVAKKDWTIIDPSSWQMLNLSRIITDQDSQDPVELKRFLTSKSDGKIRAGNK